MKVFISWSGVTSRLIAEALHWWFPKVIQGTIPFVSAKDIDKGSNWTVQLTKELETTDFGVVCLTAENLTSPWLNYEAGAITKSVDSRVCPILFDVKKNEVKAPLAQLQLTELEREDILLMMVAMNSVAGSPLAAEDLREAVEIWWPKLEERISLISPSSPADPQKDNLEPAKPAPTSEEMLAEILEVVRRFDRVIVDVPHTQPTARPSLTNAQRKQFSAGLARWPELVIMGIGSSSYLDPNGLPSLQVVLGEEPPADIRAEIRTFGESLGLLPTFTIDRSTKVQEAG